MRNVNGLSPPLSSGYAHDMHVFGEYFDSFAAIADRLDHDHRNSLFFRVSWLESLHRHCLANHDPLILYAEAIDSKAHVWLFLMRGQIRGRYRSLANFYSFVDGPAFGGKYDEITCLALLREIARLASRKTHKISLHNVPDEHMEATLMRRAFRQSGWQVRHGESDTNHYLNVGGRSFDDYWRTRPGKMRSTVRRKTKSHGITTRIDTELNDENWRDYLNVYARSWKPEEASPAFLHELAETESKAGNLRLGLGFRQGRAVAAQLWTIDHDTALIHKLAYDRDEQKSSAGTILSAAMFQHVIDIDKVQQIDFGTGDDAYKADWMEEKRPRYAQHYYWPRSPLAWPDLAWHGSKRLISGLVENGVND